MRTLYLVSCGSSDPTRASIPLHLAVNGSIEVGHEVDIVLTGDATELVRPGVLESLGFVPRTLSGWVPQTDACSPSATTAG